MMNKSLTSIILAAGKGTRMNSNIPRVLHEVGGQPMIMHVIQAAKILGSEQVITVLGYEHEMVQKVIKNEDVKFALQLKQLGTAHAVLQCYNILENYHGNILILYGDVPMTKVTTLSNLMSIHEKEDACCTILTTDLPNPTGYGRIIRNSNYSLVKIVEEKDASIEERKIQEINSGIYVFDSQTLFRLLPLVGNNNKQNEYYLPDVINLIIQEGGKVAIDKIIDYIEIQGVNNLEQLNDVNELYENI